MSSHTSGTINVPAPSIETNRVLRNTYALLALTLLFSSVTAAITVALSLPYPGLVLTLVGYFGLLFLTTRYRNSGIGLAMVFALTGFMGYTLGPLLNVYLNLLNGPQLVMNAFGGTGVTFLALSGYILVSRKDLSFMGGFLMIGMLVAFLGMIAAWLFTMPMMSLAVSGMFILVMGGFILYQTSAMIHGGETNYSIATVGVYVSIYNLFLSLLQIIAAFNGDD